MQNPLQSGHFFFPLLWLLSHVCHGRREYFLGAHLDETTSVTTGTIVLNYDHENTITTFSVRSTSRWKGPDVLLILEPKNAPGTFQLESYAYGRHLKDGIVLKNKNCCIQYHRSAQITLYIRKGKCESIQIEPMIKS